MPGAQHRLVFESFGVIAEVVSDDRDLFGGLAAILPPGWRRTEGDVAATFAIESGGVVTLDGAEVARDKDAESALIRLGATIRHHVALLAPDHVFIHAGVVSFGGAAIVIPGTSHSGKSTLVAELLRAGATYHSDEYAPIDSGGLIQPYPKPLSIRRPGGAGPGNLKPVSERRTATEPIRPGLIVLTSYEPGATWAPEPRTAGEGALALLRHTVAARPHPARSMAAAGALAREAQVIEGARGEAREVARDLLSRAQERRMSTRMGY